MEMHILLLQGLIGLYISGVTAAPEDHIVHTGEENIDARDFQCAVCLAVVDIISKHVKESPASTATEAVFDIIEDVCSNKHFPSYDFIPPMMVKGCNEFMEQFDDLKIANVLSQQFMSVQNKRSHIERRLCLQEAPVCVGNTRMRSNQQKPRKKPEKQEELTDKEIEELIAQHKGKVREPRPIKTEL